MYERKIANMDQILKMGSTVTILMSLMIVNVAYGCSSGSNKHVIDTNEEDQIPWLAFITQYKDERLFLNIIGDLLFTTELFWLPRILDFMNLMAFTDCNIMDYRPLKCQSAQVSNISHHEAFTLLILLKPLRAQGSSASMIHLSPITSGDYENCLIPRIDYKQVHDDNGPYKVYIKTYIQVRMKSGMVSLVRDENGLLLDQLDRTYESSFVSFVPTDGHPLICRASDQSYSIIKLYSLENSKHPLTLDSLNCPWDVVITPEIYSEISTEISSYNIRNCPARQICHLLKFY